MTTLIMPPGPRATELLEEMDTRFFQLIEGLAAPLRAHAMLRGTYDGSNSQEPFEGLSSMNPGLTCTPWMFWGITCPLEDDLFLDLALGGGLIILSSILLDHLSDQQAEKIGETVLLQSELQSLGTSLLRGSSGDQNELWRYEDRLLEEHRVGLATELQWLAHPDLLTESAFVEAVSAKFAPIALTMVAFLAATNQHALMSSVEQSIKQLAVASQLLDDLGDWKEDVRAHRLTWFVKSLHPRFDWTSLNWPTAEILQNRIDQNWSEIRLLNWAKDWLNRSLDSVEGIDCPAWTAYLNGFHDLADAHLSGRTARHLAHSIEELMAD